MNDNISQTDLGPTSAIVSLVSLIISFFDATHVWLQNTTLLVSLLAGCLAIVAGIKKLIK
jgi:uncharacterized membrane protein YqjE